MEEYAPIKRTVDLYGFAIDSLNLDLFDDVFTKDVQIILGGTKQWTDREKLKSDFVTFHESFDATQHVMTSLVYEIEGEIAHAVTYALWLLVRRGAPGGDVFRAQGWYEDELVRGGRGWLITKRLAKITHWEGNRGLAGIADPDPFGGVTRMATNSQSMEVIARSRGI